MIEKRQTRNKETCISTILEKIATNIDKKEMDTIITCNYKDFWQLMLTPLHSSSFHSSFVLHTTQCSTDLYKFVISGKGAHRFPNQALASCGTCWIPSERWSVWNKMRSTVKMTRISLVPEPLQPHFTIGHEPPPQHLFWLKSSFPANLKSVSLILSSLLNRLAYISMLVWYWYTNIVMLCIN